MDAFDSDALIYAATPGHALGQRVAALFSAGSSSQRPVGFGSLLLLPEVLGKPLHDGATDEVRLLAGLLARLELRPLDEATARLAAALAAGYNLKAADAVHLATAVASGAERFITNNSRAFPQSISEIAVVYPADLDNPADGPA